MPDSLSLLIACNLQISRTIMPLQEHIIYTSVPPKTHRLQNGAEVGALYQRQCIDSWRTAGFSIVSVNSASEANQVRALGLPIDVETVNTPGRPYIAEILELAAAQPTRLCGIVNADCKIIGPPKLSEILLRHVDGGVLLGERVDIDADTDMPMPGTCGGFDAFFFESTSVKNIDDRYYRIGDPWWDYWFPLEFAMLGLSVQRIGMPFLSHLYHSPAWNREAWIENGQYLRKTLESKIDNGQLPKELKDLLISEGALRQQRPNRFALATYYWLRSRPESVTIKLFPEHLNDFEVLLTAMREYQATYGLGFRRYLNRYRGLKSLVVRAQKIRALGFQRHVG
jgi:hypothetical protein